MSASKLSLAETRSPALRPLRDQRSHVVHFYESDDGLLEQLTQFLSGALLRGGAAMVVATEAHRIALAPALQKRGVDLAEALSQGRYLLLDAAGTLSQILIDGVPDPECFETVMAGAVASAKSAAKRSSSPLAIFAEMVALLWKDGNYACRSLAIRRRSSS